MPALSSTDCASRRLIAARQTSSALHSALRAAVDAALTDRGRVDDVETCQQYAAEATRMRDAQRLRRRHLVAHDTSAIARSPRAFLEPITRIG
ncbi:hypothetical protein [Halocalculus aciditolerans]|uniref:hypothetical protein n=1 Tax=Halocalculus aciditolerans TaxID=1383812 RepID=UPI00166600F5|nr:hypothetical protein [Halocalculus aciditolerans]